MALITGKHEGCGEVELRSRDVTIGLQQLSPETIRRFYRFRCPLCQGVKITFINYEEARRLFDLNCNVAPTITYPIEIDEIQNTIAPPLDENFVIDAIREIQQLPEFRRNSTKE